MMDARIKSGHDELWQSCWLHQKSFSMMSIIIPVAGTSPMDDQAPPKIEYGVTPTEVMASMAGLGFVRAIFDGRLPAPPIMQTLEPLDSTAQPGGGGFHSNPAFRHHNPIRPVPRRHSATLLGLAEGARG